MISPTHSNRLRAYAMFVTMAFFISSTFAQGVEGYYRYPAVHEDVVYFAAEGDLWRVSLDGGLAQRLTTHPGEEGYPAVSPDGSTLAFSGTYEGPSEVYVMPTSGGLPTRLTFDRESSRVMTWTEDGKVVYATTKFSTLPQWQLVELDPQTFEHSVVPLAQASEGFYGDDGTVYFVYPTFHNNVTKRYKGGTARQIWSFAPDATEAVKLTTDYTGESHHPMWWNGRVYFITDRDGTMNIWSMAESGSDLQQHTKHEGFDVREADLHSGNIVYRHGADLWHYNIDSDADKRIPITLATDLDQLREKWEESPEDYITSTELSHDGSKVLLTARGRVFVAPAEGGRFVQASRAHGVRYRDAVFSADGENIIVLSDETGEFEFVKMPASGIGDHETISNDGEVLRYKGFPSPDDRWLAYDDLMNNMWLLNMESGESKKISTNQQGIGQIEWSPDGKWVAFIQRCSNTMSQLLVYGVDSGELIPMTTDRANDNSPAWSPDGKFIYFLSDRNFRSLVGSPWGSRQPEPYFDKQWKIYHIALEADARSPFRPKDELYEEPEEKDSDSVVVTIDQENIMYRIAEVPISAGNYRGLEVNKSGLFAMSRSTGLGAKTDLIGIAFDSKPKVTTVTSGVSRFQMSADGKKILIAKGKSMYVTSAKISKAGDLGDKKVDLSKWKFPINVKEDWKQIYTDAWRMERDYFYDKNMHGVDWDAMHEKYLPMLDRVTTRAELSDVIGRYVGELSALHTSVRGGDVRDGDENISVADLGAHLTRDTDAGGYRIERIYRADPDYPDELSPLADPYLNIKEGDIITMIDGEQTLSASSLSSLLRNKAGVQVHLEIKSGEETREVIVKPISSAYNLRYRDWEYDRRMRVEKEDSRIGYVHLRAMGSNDISQWYREFYPVYDKPALIIDVRHNRGGNIESLILEKLLRQPWMWWAYRAGEPYRNMQYAFNGHIVVLCNAQTASDGELFAEGFRRLGLGKVIGMRTWGGEIWLGSQNRLSDGGLARAPMNGVYTTEGEWLIEGHGVDPDIEIDNLPHATFDGSDAQLDAAIQYLLQQLKEDPRDVPKPPAYPDKSFKN